MADTHNKKNIVSAHAVDTPASMPGLCLSSRTPCPTARRACYTSDMRSRSPVPFIVMFILLVVVGAAAAYAVMTAYETRHTLAALQADIHALRTNVTAALATTTADLSALQTQTVGLSDQLYNDEKQITEIASHVQGFDQTVNALSGSVQTLQKLSTTDPQLLEKYSKVYFLNENYMPADLTTIDEQYDYKNGKQVTVLSDMWPFLKELLAGAWRDDVQLMVLSGYRSFTEQATLKEGYTVRYGTGANQFSADQGYSEHQLGTAIDFTTNAIGENLDAFGSSSAYAWLTDNAYKYGFILSYPEGNTYYEFEPWHWRFVGIDLATYLHRQHKYFYDLEQREIDSYLSTLWDDN